MTIDLHIHTTASDGSCNPVHVVQRAADAGLKIISIADHETTHGYFLARNEARARDISMIPAVELLTTYKDREVHLLGYLTDPENQRLQENLSELRHLRTRSAEESVKKMQECGFNICWENVKNLAGEDTLISKGHIMRAVNEAGYINNRSDAVNILNEYLSPNGLAYVAHDFSFTDAVELLKSNGGIPVLAHLALIRDDVIVDELCHLGIEGLEVYYCYFGDQRKEWVEKYSLMAETKRLFKTGGSDYHGIYTPVTLGETEVPVQAVGEFLKVFGLI